MGECTKSSVALTHTSVETDRDAQVEHVQSSWVAQRDARRADVKQLKQIAQEQDGNTEKCTNAMVAFHTDEIKRIEQMEVDVRCESTTTFAAFVFPQGAFCKFKEFEQPLMWCPIFKSASDRVSRTRVVKGTFTERAKAIEDHMLIAVGGGGSVSGNSVFVWNGVRWEQRPNSPHNLSEPHGCAQSGNLYVTGMKQQRITQSLVCQFKWTENKWTDH